MFESRWVAPGIIFLILVVVVLVVFLRSNKRGGEEMEGPSPTGAPLTTSSAQNSLEIKDEVAGIGAVASAGKKITVNYVGTLTDGVKFDSSYDRGQPFTFTLGAGQVIQGWDQGLVGMKVGGKRKLTIPPELGYGNQAVGVIPANSTLVFEVELLKVE